MACVDEEEVVHWPTDAEHMVKAQRSQLVKCQKEKSIKEKGSGVKQGKEGKSELRGKKIKDRKESRRRRRKIQAAGDGESLDCCVLLTRLEEKGIVADKKDAPKPRKQKNIKVKKKLHSSSFQRHTKSGFKKTSNQQALEPKINQSDALLMQPAPAFEPRRRRMASLNAEAVNSLLLYRDNSLASNLVKKRQLPPNEDPANGSLIKTEHKTQKVSLGGKESPKEGSKKKKRAAADAQNIDWLALLAPTPRRQAGLTAATLLRLTSSASGTKRQKKIESKQQSEAATTTQGEDSNKVVCGETMETKRITHPKHEDQLKHRQQGKEDANNSQKGTSIQGFCNLCKSAGVDPDWKATTGGGQACLNHALQCSSLLGFSLNTIKEEQVETEVSTCYCCSKEGCIKYCHRLALFVKDKTFKEPEDSSLSEVFHHHHHHHLHHHHLLQSTRSITHPAITISPNTYTCLPGYYVRFNHPDNAPSPISPAALCPRSGKGTKLLPSTGPQSSGITHPVYCCTSVETCYGEPCRINSCSSYSSVIPAIPRGGCSFSTADCTTCNHSTKRDDYPSTLSDHHSPSSIPICPSPRIPTGCPIPTVPPAGQSVPHIQTPLSDPSQPQPPLQVAKECPQSAKSPSGSRSSVRSTGSISSAVRPVNRNKQKLISASAGEQKVAKQPKITRQKTTNGWRPVGPPFHKKVFSVGEEAPVLRKCFEGVQRDGELIQVRDTVLLKSGPRKKSLPYVAKISALWEEPETGELMMSLFWYYRPEHTQGGHNPSIHCENEVFASRHQDVNSVACIEDKCYVLTLAQYCRFCALVKRRRDGVRGSAASLIVPPVVGSAMPTHHCVPDDVDPELVFFCRHVYDFRYGRLLKNLQ